MNISEKSTKNNAALREAHRAALLDHGNTFLWTTDADLNLVMLNKRAREYVEKKLKLETGKDLNLHHIIHKHSLLVGKTWNENIEKARRTGEKISFTFNQLEDGRFNNVKATVEPIVVRQEMVGFCCSFEDNTEYYLINRLNQLKSRFQSEVLKINRTGDLLWAITDEILSNLYLEDAIILIKKDNHLEIAAAHGSKRKGHRAIADDLRIPLDRGITGYVATTGESVMTNDTTTDNRYFAEHFEAFSEVVVPIKVNGEIIGVINCESSHKHFFEPVHLQLLQEVAEVTATRIAEIENRQKLELLEEQHQAVLKSTHNGYILLNKELVLVNFNRAAEKGFLKYIQADLKPGISAGDFLPEPYCSAFEQNSQSALSGKQVRTIRNVPQPQGTTAWFRFTYSPAHNNADEVFGVTVVIENITDIKEQEQAVIEKNKRLEKSNSELDKFVYSVSHDLRAPLSSMMGLNKLISMSANMSEVQSYSTMLEEAAQSMDGFIRKILDYSRNSRSTLEKSLMDLENELGQALEKIRFMPEFRTVQIHSDLKVKNIYTDQYRLGIILNNLLSNAVKYQDPDKEEQHIKVSSSSEDGKTLKLVFTDNGQGIDEKYIPDLFEMFYKASSDSTGSGLGLYIMREAVEVLGGTTSVKSRKGEGTTFTIILPETIK